MAEHSHGDRQTGGGGAGRRVFWGFVLIAAFFLITEHRAHLFQYLPFLLILACLLMHLFHGHKHGGDKKESSEKRAERKSAETKTGHSDRRGGGCH